MSTQRNHPFRMFISYAHADKLLVEDLVGILESLGFIPLWDKDINPGKPFTQEIKELITRSHLFLPVITSNSNHRPWVHQETGFAIALNIPVLPICIGQTPSEMIADVQALVVRDDLSDFSGQLAKINLMQLVVPKPNKPLGMIEIAETSEERIRYIVKYANWVIDLGEYGTVRTQARFTGFSVPDADITDPIWDQREGKAKRNGTIRQLQREERKILERHARMAGCRLIIDPRAETFGEQGDMAQEAHLIVLAQFLKSMPEHKLEVVVSPRAQDTSLSIVGDYFVYESMASRPEGYVHSVFNSHSPTVLQRVQRFDQLFNEIKTQNPMSIKDVVDYIEELIEKDTKSD